MRLTSQSAGLTKTFLSIKLKMLKKAKTGEGWSDVYGSLQPGLEYLSADAEFRQRPHELLPGSFLTYLRSLEN